MPEAYYYSSTAAEMALAGSINGSTTAVTVDGVAGLPSTTPFKLVLDPGLGTEEIVKVTGISGTTLTVVRGWDGTSGQAHSNLAAVRHMVTAEDIRLSRQHEAATTAHGVTSALVGKDDAQALTRKDLSSATNTFPSTLATDSEVAAAVSAHAVSKTTHGVSGEVMGTASVQVVTNKNLTSTTNTFPSTLATAASLTAHAGDTAAHGATGGVVGATKVQTLTGKTIDGGSNTLSNIPQAAVTGLPALATTVAGHTTTINSHTTDLTALKSDTGWVNVTKAAGFTGTLQYRLAAGMVSVRGDLAGTLASGTFTAVSGAAMPAAARPGLTPARSSAYIGSGTSMGSVEVLTDGTINVQCPTAGSVAKFNFSFIAG